MFPCSTADCTGTAIGDETTFVVENTPIFSNDLNSQIGSSTDSSPGSQTNWGANGGRRGGCSCPTKPTTGGGTPTGGQSSGGNKPPTLGHPGSCNNPLEIPCGFSPSGNQICCWPGTNCAISGGTYECKSAPDPDQRRCVGGSVPHRACGPDAVGYRWCCLESQVCGSFVPGQSVVKMCEDPPVQPDPPEPPAPGCPTGQIECPAAGNQCLTNSDCNCLEQGKEIVNGQCLDPCQSPLIRKSDNSCGCPNDGDELVNGSCVSPCAAPTTERQADGSCACPNGGDLINGQCLSACPSDQPRCFDNECRFQDACTCVAQGMPPYCSQPCLNDERRDPVTGECVDDPTGCSGIWGDLGEHDNCDSLCHSSADVARQSCLNRGTPRDVCNNVVHPTHLRNCLETCNRCTDDSSGTSANPSIAPEVSDTPQSQ